MATATTKAKTAKPETQASSYVRRKQQATSMRAFVLLGIIAWIVLPVVLPMMPNSIAGFDWKKAFSPSISFLWIEMPPESVALPFVKPMPLQQWLNWGVAAFAAFICLTLLQHLLCIYAQRVVPLRAKHIYRQIRIPASAVLKPSDGLTLLKQLHGMLPAGNPKRGTPTPLVLRWTAIPDQPVRQGLSILDAGDLPLAIGKVVEGIAGGTRVEKKDDPLLKELKPGRYICVCELYPTAPSDMPLAMSGDTSLLEALLPALTPQTGIVCADMQVLLEPTASTDWKLGVLARLEQLRAEISASERKALEMKAEGPSFRCKIRLFAITENADAGRTMVGTIGAAFAGTAQTIGTTEQRLRAGPVQVFPAVLDPAPSLPKLLKQIAWLLGLILGAAFGFLSRNTPTLWAAVPLISVLPVLTVSAWWRRKTQVMFREQHAALLTFAFPPRNPNCVPLWSEWLGYKD